MPGPQVQPDPPGAKQALQGLLFWVGIDSTHTHAYTFLQGHPLNTFINPNMNLKPHYHMSKT